MSDRIEAFEELAKQYESQTGVKVKFELYAPTSAYTSKIRSAAQAAKLPDVYGVLLEMRDFAAFIKGGYVYDLTPYMAADDFAWEKTFYKSAVALNSFRDDNQYGVKPGIYGVPVDVNNIQFIYNLTLLEKAGWDITRLPSTWEEFLQLGDKLKAAGIPGLVSGFGETWMLHALADSFARNIMGEEKIVETIKGNVSYGDPAWLKVFELFGEMRDRDMIFPGSVTMVNKEAEQIFANERAAITFNGSWCVNVYESMNPSLKYASSLPPKINPNGKMCVWGGTSSFVVNDASPVKDEAVKFLKWLTAEKQQRFLAAGTNNIPANMACANELKGAIAGFAPAMDNAVHPRLLSVEEFPLVTEAFDKGLQSIIIGESTPLQTAALVNETKQRQLKSAEKFKAIIEKEKQKQKEKE